MWMSAVRTMLVVIAMLGLLAVPASAGQANILTGTDHGAAQKPKKTKKAKPAKPAKPQTKAPEKPKESWQLPMKVVVVRSSDPRCEPLCPEWLMAEGEITAKTPGVFARALKRLGKRKLPVVILSPGGNMNAAMEIGRLIRRNNLDVTVGTTRYEGCAPFGAACELPKAQNGVYRGKTSSVLAYCHSACPLVLAGGVNRIANDYVSVGVHQARTEWTQDRITYRETYKIVKGKKKVISRKVVSRKPGKSYTTYGIDKRLRKTLVAYLKEMGVGAGLVADMEKAPHSLIYKLPMQRQIELGLATRTGSALDFSLRDLCSANAPAPFCVERKDFIPAPPPVKALAKLPVSAADMKAVGISSADPAMTFVLVRDNSGTCEPDCVEWIAAQGVVTADSPRDLGRLLDHLGSRKPPIVFSSSGGDFDAALLIGRLIRAKGLATAILRTGFDHCSPNDSNCKPGGHFGIYKGSVTAGGKCNGACLFAATGGSRMFGISPDIVLHQPSFYKTRNDSQTAAEQLRMHFSSLGVDRRLVGWMIDLKPGQTLRLTPGDRRTLLRMRENNNPVLEFDRFPRPAETCYVNTRQTACLPPEAGS